MSGHRRRVAAVACTVIALVASLTLLPATSASAQGDWLSRINGFRSSHGLAPLAVDGELTGLAQQQAGRNANSGVLAHTPNLAAGISSPWTKLGENVGYGGNPDQIWNGFLSSAPHRANLLDPAFTHVGIGVVVVGGTQWVVHRFMATGGGGGGGYYEPPPQPAPAPRRSAPPTTRAPAPAPPVVEEPPPPPPPPPRPKAEPARVAAVLDALRAAG